MIVSVHSREDWAHEATMQHKKSKLRDETLPRQVTIELSTVCQRATLTL